MDPFADSVAIVTGGASGIGRALCVALAARGAAHVVAADVDTAGAEETAGAIRRAGGRAEARALDVTDAAAVDTLVRDVASAQGRLDLMVNDAGLGAWGDAAAMPLETWRRVVDVNFWGVVHGTRAAVSVMAPRRAGRIVNVASLAGLVPAPTVVPYAAAKHAVVGLSTSWAPEAAEDGVAIHVACPGPVRTGFHAALLRVGSAAGPRPPAAGLDADAAAAAILGGVARGDRVIVFPREARWIFALQRLWPARLVRRGRQTVRRMRASGGGGPPG